MNANQSVRRQPARLETMHCGPPAEISEESIERITKQASVNILKDYTQVPDDLNLISRLAVAAS